MDSWVRRSRIVGFAVFSTLLVACDNVRALSPTVAYQICGVDSTSWSLLAHAPPDASSLIATLTDRNSSGQFYWFKSGHQSLLLCQAQSQDPDKRCGNRTWRFGSDSSDSHPTEVKTVTVCSSSPY